MKHLDSESYEGKSKKIKSSIQYIPFENTIGIHEIVFCFFFLKKIRLSEVTSQASKGERQPLDLSSCDAY